jgi:cell division protein FtsB
MTRSGAAGSGPGAKRSAASRTQRSRAAAPAPRPPAVDSEPAPRQTTWTGRAAILLLAAASVMVAVALPLKIWLGQRSDIASLSAQTRDAQAHIDALNAQHKQWESPAYIESQARQRLHYGLPGQKSYVVLGQATHAKRSAAKAKAIAAAGPWYSTFWKSEQAAGKGAATK